MWSTVGKLKDVMLLIFAQVTVDGTYESSEDTIPNAANMRHVA
jgi:hypothetical protein